MSTEKDGESHSKSTESHPNVAMANQANITAAVHKERSASTFMARDIETTGAKASGKVGRLSHDSGHSTIQYRTCGHPWDN